MFIVGPLTRLLTSRTTAKGVINISILATSYSITLILSAVATALFHANYVPDASISWPVYLQYGQGVNPFSLFRPEHTLPAIQQDYDVIVSLTLPASPKNMDLGNFMITTVWSAAESESKALETLNDFQDEPITASILSERFPRDQLLLRSRRPALVPYRDPLVTLIRRVLLLPFYIVAGDGSKITIDTRLTENLNFKSTANLPRLVFVEVQAGQSIQIYSASVKLVARMSGLRYLMYHYRLVSYIILTTMFWGASMGFTTVTWLAWMAINAFGNESTPDASNATRLATEKRKLNWDDVKIKDEPKSAAELLADPIKSEDDDTTTTLHTSSRADLLSKRGTLSEPSSRVGIDDEIKHNIDSNKEWADHVPSHIPDIHSDNILHNVTPAGSSTGREEVGREAEVRRRSSRDNMEAS